VVTFTPAAHRIGVAVLAAALLIPAAAAPASAAAPTPVQGDIACATYTLPVRVADPGPANQTLWAQLCYPTGRPMPTTVQLLVHGATYNHLYWDFPTGDGQYSYMRSAVRAGYATLNVDRIGNGASSHPPGASLDVPAGAVALHDAVTALRTGRLGGHRFSRVVWVGHSLGSTHGWFEAGRYRDVDALVLTGDLHTATAAAFNLLTWAFWPAAGDPQFAGAGLDQDYLTTVPGSRQEIFFAPATTDPAVVALDEVTKDTLTTGQIAQMVDAITLPPQQSPSSGVNLPVLLVVGGQDVLFCPAPGEVNPIDCDDAGSVVAAEAPYFGPHATLSALTVADTGHDLALSTSAPVSAAAIQAWIGRTIRP
jgi:hypothetical protein